MSKPTSIQIAEDLKNTYQNVADVYHDNPNEAVFRLQDVVNLLKSYGHPEPDWKGHAILMLSKTDKDAYRARMRKLGKVIQQAMKDKGITQAQLVAMTGRPKATVNRWTSGQNLEVATLCLIEKHLDIKLLNL